MNNNLVISFPQNTLDDFRFYSENNDEKTLVFKQHVMLGDEVLDKFEKKFRKLYTGYGYTIWSPINWKFDAYKDMEYPGYSLFYFGDKNTENLRHNISSSEFSEVVTSKIGQQYKMAWRYHHWIFYEPI